MKQYLYFLFNCDITTFSLYFFNIFMIFCIFINLSINYIIPLILYLLIKFKKLYLKNNENITTI
jgi:hypothetical protein